MNKEIIKEVEWNKFMIEKLIDSGIALQERVEKLERITEKSGSTKQ